MAKRRCFCLALEMRQKLKSAKTSLLATSVRKLWPVLAPLQVGLARGRPSRSGQVHPRQFGSVCQQVGIQPEGGCGWFFRCFGLDP